MNTAIELCKILELTKPFGGYETTVVSDYPNDDSMFDLLTPTSEGGSVKAVVNVLDGGSIESPLQFRGGQKYTETNICNVFVWTANPIVREVVAKAIHDWLRANPYFGPVGVDWEIKRVRSNGYEVGKVGIYGRSMTVWIATLS